MAFLISFEKRKAGETIVEKIIVYILANHLYFKMIMSTVSGL